MRILKYKLEITDHQRIEVGNNQAIPLSVAEQNGKLMLWANVLEDHYPKNVTGTIIVDIIGTGNLCYDGSVNLHNFIGTAVMANGLVWHVFARFEACNF